MTQLFSGVAVYWVQTALARVVQKLWQADCVLAVRVAVISLAVA
ncbi:hypothetical protein ACTXGK_12645 [Psychrobacter sp. T6-5]